LDVEGNFIPTYDNEDIKNFAKVFTGLGPGGITAHNDDITQTQFGLGFGLTDLTVPMKMYEAWHEPGEKILLNGYSIPDGQSGMEDIEDAVEHIFNHQNVGPFLARRLIQQLVKSNPTPEYISRIAGKFNDNGTGIRGDMKAVIKAILLDVEARSCDWINEPVQGKLRAPILRQTQFAKGLGGINAEEIFWQIGTPLQNNLGQHPLHSNSVFNFYLPDFQPNGTLADLDLYGPEYQIHNARTSVSYLNYANLWTIEEYLLYTYESNIPYTFTDYTTLLEFLKDSEVIVNKLDVLFTHGQLTDKTREIIINAIEPLNGSTSEYFSRLKLATYLIMISPDYVIQK